MKKFIYKLTGPFPDPASLHVSLLVFRILIAAELMLAHGLKKIGVGVEQAELIPNPLHLPDTLNTVTAIAANLFFPVLIILGLFTRLAVIPVLAVTLTGYFVVHWHDALLEKDMPYMYSVAFLLLAVLGSGKYSLDYLIHRKAAG